MKMLRLAGAPGVGKSTTGWAIALDLAAGGIAAAYVDIDQLGMCYPSPEGDLDRWGLKERVLAGIAEVHRRAGVTHLVISGVAQAAKPLPPIKGVSIRAVWLDASEEARRGRLDARGLDRAQLEQSLAAGTAEDSQVHPIRLRVETENRTEPEIANEDWRNGHRTGFADIAQLSFTWNLVNDLGLPALACLYKSFREAGVASFIIVAPLGVDPAAVRAARPNAQVSFVRLTPSEQDLRRHAFSRQDGYGAALAGDDVRGAAGAAQPGILKHYRGGRRRLWTLSCDHQV